ncbi:MAG: recombinase family protein [Gemmatimonadaceae bacterium]|nr:recombinase family protein [Acetobacteraceae bacterium]
MNRPKLAEAFGLCRLTGANRTTIGIMAIIAEGEREAISVRTKEALAAAKARGVKLGGYRGVPPPDPQVAAAARVAKADRFAAQVSPTVRELRAAGMGLSGIARELTTREIRTARGGSWTANTVKNLLARSAGA